MSELTTFIPAGGIGSRLHPHTLDTPKPLLLMGSPDRRIIDWPIEASAAASSQVWVGADYLDQQVSDYLSSQPNTTVLTDQARLGSAGSLLKHYPVMSNVESEGDMLILPGDHIYEGFSAADFWKQHIETEADITLLTVPQKNYGEYVTVQDHQAVAIEETPVPDSLSTTGIFIIRNKFLMEWAWKNLRVNWENQNYNIYHDIVSPAVGRAAVAHYYMDAASGYWEDTGVPARYHGCNMRISGGQNVVSSQANVDSAASLESCVVLGETTIDAFMALKNAIISTRKGQLAVTQVDPISNRYREASVCGEKLAAQRSSNILA